MIIIQFFFITYPKTNFFDIDNLCDPQKKFKKENLNPAVIKKSK
jgi:hypothetical protein